MSGPGYGSLRALWGSDADHVWAVGLAGILQWDGIAWSKTSGTTNGFLVAVWGSAPDDVWASGSSATCCSGTLVHWDGSAWTRKESGAGGYALRGLFGLSATDVRAVGDLGTILRFRP